MLKTPDGFVVTEHLKPKYQTGDILWVREAWAILFPQSENPTYLYKANGGGYGQDSHWRSSMFMPREAARIFLRVTDVRVERLNSIISIDAKREGFAATERGSETDNFHNMWDSLNAKRGYSWDSNPWVWVYEFERIEL